MHRRRRYLNFHVLVDHLGTDFDVFLGEFIIKKEEASSAGVRRIKAVLEN